MSQIASSKNLWLVVFPKLLQSPCFSKMRPVGLYLDQRNSDKVERDEQAWMVRPILSFNLSHPSVSSAGYGGWQVTVKERQRHSLWLCQSSLLLHAMMSWRHSRASKIGFTVLVQWLSATHQAFWQLTGCKSYEVAPSIQGGSKLAVVLGMWLEPEQILTFLKDVTSYQASIDW